MKNSAVTFDGIRKSIIETLSADPTFKDYNFTAPAISTLIDALAYVSHYHIRYANFALNETFLDSAQLRKNVVSRARELAYIPYQYSAAKATIKLKVDGRTCNVAVDNKVPENTMFLASSGNTSYIFRSVKQAVFEQVDDVYWEATVDLIEGTWVEETFKQDEHYTNRYFLLNDRVDINTLDVTVYQNSSYTSSEKFIPREDITSFGPDNPIYYLQEAYNGKLELYFGDGVLSKKLQPGNIIRVRYLVTNGGVANNIVSFALMNNISATIGTNNVKVELVEQSHSGGDREDIESIRFNAPKFFQRQDRNVTTSDYNVAVTSKFGGWIDSITSWGGEDNEPYPQYAKIFICVKPKYTDILSPAQKTAIIEHLNKKNLPCIEPVIVDPEYINVIMTLEIDWKQYETDYTRKQIQTLIEEKIANFFKTNITSFKTTFRYSKFLTELTAIDSSIDSIVTNVKLQQFLIPDTKITSSYVFNFGNRIVEGSVLIGSWTENNSRTVHTMYDDGEGNLVHTHGQTKEIIGSVDYMKGVVKVNSYLFGNGVQPTKIPVVVSPYGQNINLSENYLLKLTNLTVNINELDSYKS